ARADQKAIDAKRIDHRENGGVADAANAPALQVIDRQTNQLCKKKHGFRHRKTSELKTPHERRDASRRPGGLRCALHACSSSLCLITGGSRKLFRKNRRRGAFARGGEGKPHAKSACTNVEDALYDCEICSRIGFGLFRAGPA